MNEHKECEIRYSHWKTSILWKYVTIVTKVMNKWQSASQVIKFLNISIEIKLNFHECYVQKQTLICCNKIGQVFFNLWSVKLKQNYSYLWKHIFHDKKFCLKKLKNSIVKYYKSCSYKIFIKCFKMDKIKSKNMANKIR